MSRQTRLWACLAVKPWLARRVLWEALPRLIKLYLTVTPVPFVSSQTVSAVAGTAGSAAAPLPPVGRDAVLSGRRLEELLHRWLPISASTHVWASFSEQVSIQSDLKEPVGMILVMREAPISSTWKERRKLNLPSFSFSVVFQNGRR